MCKHYVSSEQKKNTNFIEYTYVPWYHEKKKKHAQFYMHVQAGNHGNQEKKDTTEWNIKIDITTKYFPKKCNIS